jgi:hypothetical protein
MSTQHPITPPLELVDKWEEEWHHSHFKHGDVDLSPYIATKAAQWGADQELEACCEWVEGNISTPEAAELRDARRPKPPSLKERIAAAITDGDERTALLLLNEALPND